jgi:hypothetical protein
MSASMCGIRLLISIYKLLIRKLKVQEPIVIGCDATNVQSGNQKLITQLSTYC